jgi:multiple sugar transport system permease protein
MSVILLSVWQGFGYNMLVFSAALDGIPDSITDAAAIDGVGKIRRLFSIQLPMISPALFFGMTLTIITSFQVFAQAYVLTGGGPADSTNTMVLYLFRTGFIFHKLGYASTIAWGLFSMIMLVTALQFVGQKRWVHYDA